MSLLGPPLPTSEVHQSRQLSEVLGTCQSTATIAVFGPTQNPRPPAAVAAFWGTAVASVVRNEAVNGARQRLQCRQASIRDAQAALATVRRHRGGPARPTAPLPVAKRRVRDSYSGLSARPLRAKRSNPGLRALPWIASCFAPHEDALLVIGRRVFAQRHLARLMADP
jgi:hypothetical protein